MPTLEELAKQIVKEILNELRGRRGFRHLLEEIEYSDEETWKEMNETLVGKVSNILDVGP